jgi:AcrR family transcriptional regulator
LPRESHKERLLEGALECLRTKGYAHTTARDIAAAAGGNLGSIGYHYGSKDQLLDEALIEGFRAWTAQISSRVAGIRADDPIERLRVTWDAMREELERQEGLLRAFLEALAPASRSPELRAKLAAFYREARGEVAGLVGQSMGPGARDAPEARTIASLLIALSDGLQLQWFLEPGETPSADQIGRAVVAALTALATTSPAARCPDATAPSM